ncbi:hypothetical protein [Lentibacillus juripiscarius]|uniref:hypothetical protein n=1 Tax=Lentibacillus juripiscarius TaxID=257446 RepID=UPI0036D3B48B
MDRWGEWRNIGIRGGRIFEGNQRGESTDNGQESTVRRENRPIMGKNQPSGVRIDR